MVEYETFEFGFSLLYMKGPGDDRVKNYFKTLVIVGKSMYKGMSRKMLESCSAFLSYVF